jgi:hypothetical protein
MIADLEWLRKKISEITSEPIEFGLYTQQELDAFCKERRALQRKLYERIALERPRDKP